MTRTLRLLACTALLSAIYTVSGCCTYGLDACISCVSCLISGPSLPSPFAVPPEDDVREIGVTAGADARTSRAAMSY